MSRLCKGNKCLLFTIIFSLLFLTTQSSQFISLAIAFQSDDAPIFDFAVFNMISKDSDLSRLDLYVKIKFDELQFLKKDKDNFRAEYKISVVINDKFDNEVDSKEWKEEIITDSIDEINSTTKTKLSKVTFNFPPGEYKIGLDLQDSETRKIGHQERSIILRNYATDEILTSDVIYLEHLSENEDGNFEFLPKVSGLRHEDSKLYAYFEVYNIPESDSIHVIYKIRNQENEVVGTNEYWRKSSGMNTKNITEISGYNLPHGKYSTQIQIINKSTIITLEHPFSWYWEGLPESLSSLDEGIEVLKYLISNKDLNNLKKTDKNEQYKEFLNFWKRHDPTPETYENELHDEYYERIKYSNDNFFGINKKGWKTDMGWVYVTIGAPDAIDRTPYNQRISGLSQRSINASEVWDYYKYNRKLVFIDENGFGEYRLTNLHTFYEITK